jgi:hypothetical protein
MQVDQPKIAAAGELGHFSQRNVILRDESELRVAKGRLDESALKPLCSVKHAEGAGCAVEPVSGRLTLTGRGIDRRTEKDRIVTNPMDPEKPRSGCDGNDRQRPPGQPRRRERRCTARTCRHGPSPRGRSARGLFGGDVALKQSPHRLPGRARASLRADIARHPRFSHGGGY